MARNRRPGEQAPPPTRGPTETTLHTLLLARRFRAAAGGERVAQNLVAHGAEVGPDAAAWIGDGTPPREAPSLSLGPFPGSLGPHSYGFLNNADAVAALDLPRIERLPPVGSLGVVVTTRAALPDLIPLFCARELPISWIISVGDGDPSEVISFLSEDAGTDAIALALGPGTRAAGLRESLGAKPCVVLGGDAVDRAVARRAGAHVVDRIGEWIALAALLGTGASVDAPLEIWVSGGGLAWVKTEAERYALAAAVTHLEESNPDALHQALEQAQPPRSIVVVGATLPDERELRAELAEGVALMRVDTRQPEQVSRLLKALARERAHRRAETAQTVAAPLRAFDPDMVTRVRAETEGTLNDHDCKRLLKAWGLKVTRQAPTGTPTGAVKVARLIDLPVMLARGDDERLAESLPEVRRIAGLLLEQESEEPRSVMIRERFPDAPRTRVKITAERGVGLLMRIGDSIALLPLDEAESLRLAQHTGARRSADQRAVAAVLASIGAAAIAESAVFDLELYVGAEPVVLRASGSLRRAP